MPQDTLPNIDAVEEKPGEVVAPIVPETKVDPTPEEVDAKEWADAAKDLFPEKIKPDTTTETTTTETTTTDTTTDTTTVADPNVTTDTTQSPTAPVEPVVDTAPIEARMAQRKFEESVESVKNDVKEKMFGEILSDLKDAQGTPIKSAKDLENIINPNTNEGFTPEEAAAAWSNYSQQRSQAESQVEQIAKVNVTLKDEADLVANKYGKVLSADPELKQKLFSQYEKTLEKDPKTGTIVKAPFSILEYYNSILEPRLSADAASQAQVQQAEAAKAEAEKKAEDIKLVQKQSDRADIFGNGKASNLTKDEEEWQQAAKDYYGK